MADLSTDIMDSARMKDAATAETRAYKESMWLDVSQLAGYALETVGQRIAATALGLKDARQIRKWQDGVDIRGASTENRLRLLYRVARTVALVYDDATARAFLRSSSPYLGDRAPVLEIAADGEAEVLTALRSFLDG